MPTMSDSPYIFDVVTTDFEDKVLTRSRTVPVLVDFWAAWCGPCRTLAPVLEHVAAVFEGRLLIAKVDTDAEPELAARFGIRSLPTIVLFADGQPRAQTMGAQPESAIRALVAPFVTTPGDELAQQAADAVSRGHLAEGQRLLEEAVAHDPERAGPRFALAELLLASGDAVGAKEVIEPLNALEKESDAGQAVRDKIRLCEDLEGAPATEELLGNIERDPGNLESRYLLAARKVLEGDPSAALEHFFEIMRRDRKFRDDAGRHGLVAVFNMLDPDSELAADYRKRMAALLY